MKKIDLKNVGVANWIKGALCTLLYILVVIWVGNYWLMLGVPVVADIYITRIVPWGFWKRRKDGGKPSVLVEWLDAILFALVAVYFIHLFIFQNYQIPTSSLEKSMLVGDHLLVSKVSYGPRMPNAPIYMPMTQNTLPLLNCKSYIEWPLWGYKRLAGLGNVERNDIVVFNFPAGDTVCTAMPNPDYYTILLSEGSNLLASGKATAKQAPKNTWERNHMLMQFGRQRVANAGNALGDIVWRPVDKRDCYVKRCIAMPGDTLEIRHNTVIINGEEQTDPEEAQHCYYISTNGVRLNDKFYEQLGISNEDRIQGGYGPEYILPLNRSKAKQVAQMPIISSIEICEERPDSTGLNVYPFSPDYPWSRDNYGPIWMPKKGATVALDEKNIVLYERIITAYEGHTLDYKNGKIYIDGAESTTYTFAMDYYYMLGDNRHKSADSRYWGFVPEDHIVGKPLFIWLSIDPDKKGLSTIRWNRLFKTVE